MLKRLEAASYETVGYDRSSNLGRLGRCLASQGQPVAAAEQYHAAMREAEVLEQTLQVQRQMSIYHANLADVMSDMGQFAAAEQKYNAALKFAQQIEDNRQVGAIRGQQGRLALMQNKLADARARYLEALKTFQGFGERETEAIVWHQLGIVAQQACAWDEAERCYKQSLSLKEHLGATAGGARTCNQLAIVAQSAGRLDEAERWYLRAIQLNKSLDNSVELARNYGNLADLLLVQDRLDEAEHYAHQARAIMETLDLSSEPWKTYDILAQIAEKRGQPTTAKVWRRKERDTFAAFPGSDVQIEQRKPLIAAVVAVAQGDTRAQAEIEAGFASLTAKGWMIADGIQRIWAGERDLDALTDDLEYRAALIIRRVLEGIAGAPSAQPTPSEAVEKEAEEDGLTLPQLIDLIEQALRGNAQLGERLHTAMQEMATQGDDPDVRALGAVLRKVLEGEREPDLSELPAERASAVRGLLGRLRQP